VKERPRQNNLNKLNFNHLKNKSVYTSNGDLLVIVESANKDHVKVKRNETNVIYYIIPKHRFEKWDDQALWLNITERQAHQNHLLGSEGNKIGFETITFRLNESVMISIRSDAENKIMSMNNLVNRILKRFVESDSVDGTSGMVHMSRPVVTELFNKKTDQEIIDLAKDIGKNSIYNTVLFMTGKRDLDTFLLWIEREMNEHSVSTRRIVEDNMHKYIIKHDLGYKFSLYYKTIIESIFNDYYGESVNFTLSDELILFKFKSHM
jgi:hypothetical protein